MNIVGEIHTYFLDIVHEKFRKRFRTSWDWWRLCSVENIVYNFPKCSSIIWGFIDTILLSASSCEVLIYRLNIIAPWLISVGTLSSPVITIVFVNVCRLWNTLSSSMSLMLVLIIYFLILTNREDYTLSRKNALLVSLWTLANLVLPSSWSLCIYQISDGQHIDGNELSWKMFVVSFTGRLVTLGQLSHCPQHYWTTDHQATNNWHSQIYDICLPEEYS